MVKVGQTFLSVHFDENWQQLWTGKNACPTWWARRDSNPQPGPCKGGRLPLTYVPISKITATLALSQSVIVGKALMCVKKRNCDS